MSTTPKNNHPSVSDIFVNTPCLTLDQLTAYVEDRLSAHEHHEVEKHLIDCELCSDAVEGMTLAADSATIKKTVTSLKSDLHARLHKRPALSLPKKKSWRIVTVPVAAIVLVGLISILYTVLQKPSTDVLFSRYFEPYPNTVPLMRGESPSGRMEWAMTEYEAADYAAALTMLQEIIASDPENTTALFYTGVSCLCLGEPEQAIGYFQRASRGDTDEFEEQTRWYTGLSYLRNRQSDRAEAIFREITAYDQHYKKEESIQLLNALMRDSDG